MRELPKDVLKMASGLISLSGLAGHRRPLCSDAKINVAFILQVQNSNSQNLLDLLETLPK